MSSEDNAEPGGAEQAAGGQGAAGRRDEAGVQGADQEAGSGPAFGEPVEYKPGSGGKIEDVQDEALGEVHLPESTLGGETGQEEDNGRP